MSWTDKAECVNVDPEVFYPTIINDAGEEEFDDGTIWEKFGDTSEYYDEARSICDMCPVKAQCLKHAMENKERFGMWGGLTPIERRRIERNERRARLKAKRALEET
jgi:WhiB family transcriptional regulator, redox-sensing transcriptional regulator